MKKDSMFKSIAIHLYTERKEYLRNIDKNNIYSSMLNLKDSILEKFSINEDDWTKFSDDLKGFLHGLVLFDYFFRCENENFEKIAQLKKQTDVKAFLTDDSMKSHLINDCGFTNNYFTARAIVGLTDVLKIHTSSDIIIEVIPETITTMDNDSTNDNTHNTIAKVTLTPSTLNKLIDSNKELLKNILDITDDDIETVLLENFQSTYEISHDLINQWIIEYKNKKPTFCDDSKDIPEVAILKESYDLEITRLNNKIMELNSTISQLEEANFNLTYQLDEANSKLEKIKFTSNNDTTKHIISVAAHEFNEIISSSSTSSSIDIKDNIIDKICIYADEHNLIKIKDVIKGKRDLKSEIVQVILLIFLQQNSLL